MYRDLIAYEKFKDKQIHYSLNNIMQQFVSRCEIMFLATGDSTGNHCAVKSGEVGFIKVLSNKLISYKEFKGNGVRDSLENLKMNPQIGMLLMDFEDTGLGLHINGKVTKIEGVTQNSKEVFEVFVQVEECFIQCRKHLPKYQKVTSSQSYNSQYFLSDETLESS